MTSCSGTASRSSPWPAARRSPTPAARSASTARRSTPGSARSTATGSRCCARASAGVHRCLTRLPKMVEERILSFAIAHPGLGPRRVASELRRPKWGGIVVSHASVWRCLARHGLSTRAKRLALVAGYAAPYEPPRAPAPERHIDVERPGELVGHGLLLRRPPARHPGRRLAAHRDRRLLVVCLGRARDLPAGTGHQTSRLARRVARELAAAGWRLERVLSDNGGEFRSQPFRDTLAKLAARRMRIRAGRRRRPVTVRRCSARSSTSAGDPPLRATSIRATPACGGSSSSTSSTSTSTAFTHGRLTRGRIPADVVYGARKMEAR
jgi:hypothetical protein